MASIGAHIGTYQRPFEILGWALKLLGVGRAQQAPLTTPMTMGEIAGMWKYLRIS